MEIAIVIITHNRPHKLRDLLETIKQYTPQQHNIYVLDNATEPTGAGYIKSLEDKYDLELYRSGKNMYPGKARNFLFAKLQSEEFVVTLDDDMLVSKYWLKHLLGTYENTPNCGGAGPVIIQEGTNRVHSQGGYCKRSGNFITFIEHNRMEQYQRSTTTLECDWLASGCALYSREIIDEFRFDEDFPNMEDPAHSYDITQAGYKLISTAKSIITHTAGVTANKNMRSNANLSKSVCLFHDKYGLNPIKSWHMYTRLMRGVKLTEASAEQWLKENKIKFEITYPSMTPEQIAKAELPYLPDKPIRKKPTERQMPLSSRFQYIKKKKY